MFEVVLGQELQDVVRAIQVTAHQKRFHPLLQVLDRPALLDFLLIKHGSLTIPELLEVS